MKTFYLALFLFIVNLLHAQVKTNKFDLIDKRVININEKNIDSLAKKLTKPYKTELEKVRSIFRWITEHIEYDVVGYHNTEDVYAGLFRPEISSEDSIVNQDYNDRIVDKVLQSKRAICDGYSRLFKTLCDKSGLKSIIINGNVRWHSDPIGVNTNLKHAWNAILINKEWKLLDVTWASGNVNNESVTSFIKGFDESYFLSNPIIFFRDHYPEDPKWTLMSYSPPTLEQFYNFPYFHYDYFAAKVISCSPKNGLIDLSNTNKIIRLELETNINKESLYAIEFPYSYDSSQNDLVGDTSLTYDEIKKKYSPKYVIQGKKIYLDYEVKSPLTTRLDVLFNHKLVISYGIKNN